jgi:putative transposase
VLPTAAVMDSHSVQAPSAHERGEDPNMKTSGRKCHIAVDTDGRLLAMNLTMANIADSAGAQQKRCPWVKHLFRDAAR